MAIARRGRPKASTILQLIQEGNRGDAGIPCSICGRGFPRNKSLKAHLRTHTGKVCFIIYF